MKPDLLQVWQSKLNSESLEIFMGGKPRPCNIGVCKTQFHCPLLEQKNGPQTSA